MSALNNRHWIEQDGTPITGRPPPELIVYGPKMTGDQEAQVRHIYKLFTDVCLVAVGNYQVRRRTLADGTKVRCRSFLGRDVVEVWTGGGLLDRFETLFYATPSSETYPYGYTFPGNQQARAHTGDYTKNTLPPSEFFTQSQQYTGSTTWFSPRITINALGYQEVKPLVVSWRGKGWRYGKYSGYWDVETTLAQILEDYPFQAYEKPVIYPGNTHAATDSFSMRSEFIWLNDTPVMAPANVNSAAIRIITSDDVINGVADEPGTYLYFTTVPGFYYIRLYRAKIVLPTKFDGPLSAEWEHVHDFEFDLRHCFYSGPFFNASCTKMVALVEVDLDPTLSGREYQTQVIELDTTTFAQTIVHAATLTYTQERWSESRNVQGTYVPPEYIGDVLAKPSHYANLDETVTITPISPRDETAEYAIAADYKDDELVYVLAKSTVLVTQTSAREGHYKSGYSNPEYTFSGSDENLYQYEYKYEVVHNVMGVLRSGGFTSTGSNNVTFSGSALNTNEWLIGTAEVSINEVDAPANHSMVIGGNYVQAVGGDLRHDFLILLESVANGTYTGTLEHVGTARAEFTSVALEVIGSGHQTACEVSLYGPTADEDSVVTSTTKLMPQLRYCFLHGTTVLYESAADKYIAPCELPITYYWTSFSEKLLSVGSLTSAPPIVSTTVYGGGTGVIPYTAPPTQPYLVFTQGYDLSYNRVRIDALESLNSPAGNAHWNTPDCCNIAFSPTLTTEKTYGYVSFISQQLYDANGVAVQRDRFEKFYLNGEWVDYSQFAEGAGERQTLAAPVFIGTRLKK